MRHLACLLTLLLFAAPTIAADAVDAARFLRPAGFELNRTTLKKIATSYGVGTAQEVTGSAGEPKLAILCYHLTDAGATISFTAKQAGETFEYDRFEARLRRDENLRHCETLRRSQAKDFVVGGLWVGQHARQAETILKRDMPSTGVTCRKYRWKQVDVTDLHGKALKHELQNEWSPGHREHVSVCVETRDEHVTRFSIGSRSRFRE